MSAAIRLILILLLFNGLSAFYFYKTVLCRWTSSRLLRALYWVVDAIFLAFWGVMIWGVDEMALLPATFFQNFILAYLLIYFPMCIYMALSFPSLFFRRHGGRFFRILGAAVSIWVFYVIGYGGTLGLQRLRVTEFTVTSPHLPPAFDGYRVAHLSDFHLGNMRSDRIVTRIVERLDTLRPDLILFTGDLVNSRTDEAYRFEPLLRQFPPIAPSYAVLGNHDYGTYARWPSPAEREANLRALHDVYARTGWTLLDNRSAMLHHGTDSVAVIGVGNWGRPPFPQYGDLAEAATGISDSLYRILLTHDPSHWRAEVVRPGGIDLTLSGHTHAMQMVFTLFGRRYSPSSLIYAEWGGLYHDGDQYLSVNEGVGVALFPYRYGATPEITLITLRRK